LRPQDKKKDRKAATKSSKVVDDDGDEAWSDEE